MTTLDHNFLNDYMINLAWEDNQASTINKEYRPLNIGENELLSIFPEGKKIVKEKIKEYESELDSLNKEYQVSLVNVMKSESIRKDKNKSELAAFILYTYSFEPHIEWLNKQLKRLKRLNRVNHRKNNIGTITDDDIQLAKQTPIEDFLQFDRRGFACCIWHNEKTGSMKLYKERNKVWCYGCNRGGDVVDIVMQLQSINFIQAVKFILKK